MEVTRLDLHAFTDLLADILCLPDETLALTYIYMNKYTNFHTAKALKHPLDHHTLSLASLSLASKAHSTPRSPSALLLPAHSILRPSQPRLSTSSSRYSALRHTLVRAETILQRALGYILLSESPLDYIPRYLTRALDMVAVGAENYDAWTEDERDRAGVVVGRETRLERGCRELGIWTAKEGLEAGFGARTVGLAVVFYGLMERRVIKVRDEREREKWMKDVAGGKVGLEEWAECVKSIDSLRKAR